MDKADQHMERFRTQCRNYIRGEAKTKGQNETAQRRKERKGSRVNIIIGIKVLYGGNFLLTRRGKKNEKHSGEEGHGRKCVLNRWSKKGPRGEPQ